MRLFAQPQRDYDGLEKGMEMVTQLPPGGFAPLWGIVREMFPGAWQRNIEPLGNANIFAFSTVYACVRLIAGDISKIRPKLMRQVGDIGQEVMQGDAALAVLRKPNRYQTRIQFFSQWMVSKLMHGNSYILKERDGSGVVIALYPLNPFHVKPLVGGDGSVWYQIASPDQLAGVTDSPTVAAREIIHDRCPALWHPLVGVSPIYACAASATQGIRIQANSARFFENMSRPSGHLDAPGTISDPRLAELKKELTEGFTGANVGRILVTTGGMKFETMTMPADQAQLIEQLKWTVEDVVRPFGIPLYKLGGSTLPASGLATLNQEYYSQALQEHIEGIEALLGEGLGLAAGQYVEFDLEGLLRMDPQARAETYSKLIQSAVFSPNEARAKEDLPPVKGGETPYLQQQNYPLNQLAERGPPSATPAASDPSPPALPTPNEPKVPTKVLSFARVARRLRNAA